MKVPGETNTDDLSPARDAWSRPDIPLHAKAMCKNSREGITDVEKQIAELKELGFPIALVGDVMGTGSSENLQLIPSYGILEMKYLHT